MAFRARTRKPPGSMLGKQSVGNALEQQRIGFREIPGPANNQELNYE
jgi:hypothetical protein